MKVNPAEKQRAGGGVPKGFECRGFTMIEIALSLAVIGFALVAIIGILPMAMNVQRENREETIINQDASVLLEAIRNGSRGADDLTNYVVSIVKLTTEWNANRTPGTLQSNWYTFTTSAGSPAGNPGMELTNGHRIVGLLTTPKYIPIPQAGSVLSNYVIATFRSMSGAASDKFPQDNPEAREFAFTYRVIPEIMTFGLPVSSTVTNNAWDAAWTNYSVWPTNSLEYQTRARYLGYVTNLQNQWHDVRLIFRWPVLPGGNVGNAGRQVIGTSVSGRLILTNDLRVANSPLFLFDRGLYTTNAL